MTKTMSLFEAAKFFGTVGFEIEHETHRALEGAAKVVEKQAKAYIGTYDAHWPTTWLPLSERTKRDRVNKGFAADKPLLRTGELRDSIHHRVGHNEATIGTDSKIAVWQELGTSRMVPRPFLEPALKEKTPEVLERLGKAVHGKLSGQARITED
ncbi:phage virion morphogenesis protein [Bradyrhizobium septentrionale]|uniref:HK97-gp10 family putative phage morphogenesis protein n=1 Tax=Bradyrhizobium septentrionale TaxID=1404411 RepID=UPI00159684AA|nr:HK97-gp10 family putative phage morphogenesis protein [Bradyrhizobium septentrionale]UGY23718.1 phage virion morphogenesis protein [Bradyrhizobium septentrionale]